MQRGWLRISAFYAGLALLAVYMPLLHMGTHVPGAPTTDFYHFHWNFWWIRHALSNGLPVYETAHVLAPFTSNLALHTLTPFWFPLWAMLEPLTDTVTAMTGVFIAAFFLNGVLFHLWLHDEGVPHGLALVGGVMLMFSPMMFNALYWTNINLMNWFWLPLLLLTWKRVVWGRSPGWAVVFALALWAMVLSDLQYPLFVGLVLVPYGLWTLWHAIDQRGRVIGYGVAAVGAAVALLWIAGPLPALLAYETDTLNPTDVRQAVAVPFPAGYLWHDGVATGEVTFGGVLLPLLALALLVRWRVGRHERLSRILRPPPLFWLAVTLLPLWLAAGPQLPLLYEGLHRLFGGVFRYPERFVPIALVPGVAFSLQILTPIITRHRWRRYAFPVVMILLVLALGRGLYPMALQPIPPAYDFYAAMAEDDADYVVLEVPTGASSGKGIVGYPEYSALQFYGVTHGKRMVNGHFSRVDITHYWYMRTDDPLFAWLGQRRFLEQDLVEPRLTEVITGYPVGYIVVHTDLIERFTGAGTVTEVIGYLNNLPHLLCAPIIEGDALAYRTTAHDAGCDPRRPRALMPGTVHIDLGTPEDRAYIGWGWYYAEEIIPGLTARWTGARHSGITRPDHALLHLDLPAGAYELTFSAQAFGTDRQTTVSINGVVVDEVTIPAAALTEISVRVPATVIGDGEHITLALDGGLPQRPDGTNGTGRPLALLVDWVRWQRITNS